MSAHKPISDLPPFTPRLEGFRYEEFHLHSLRLLEFPLQQDQQALDLAPFQVKPPPPPPDPRLPVLPHVWYPRPTQEVRDWALGRLMPPHPGEFWGKSRQADAQRAMRPLLAGNGPLVVQGLSGYGKTSMLSHIAAHERTRQRYRRIWWLDEPERVTQSLALVLNHSLVLNESDLQTRCQMLHEHLTDQVLLVIDNLTPELVDTYRCLTPHLLMGVELPPDTFDDEEELPEDPENVVTLRGLPRTDAFDFMAHACGVTDKKSIRGQMRAWMAHIAKLLDGQPLALMIAGALFREDGLPMERLVDMFSERIDQEEPAPGVALDLSLDAMPQDYNDLLMAFGALSPNGASFEALMATVRLRGELAGYRALSFLAKRCFIKRDTRLGERYVAHPLIWERMAETEPHAAGNPFGERVQQWVLGYARRNSEDLAAIYKVQPEIFYAMDKAGQYRMDSFIHRLNMTLGPYFHEYAPEYLNSSAGPPRLIGERARAAKLTQQGLDFLHRGHVDEARSTLKEAFRLAERLGSEHEQAETLAAQAYLANETGEAAQTVELLERAAKLVYDLKADESLHIIRLGLAMAYRKQERFKDALGVLDDAPDTHAERARIYRASEQWDLMIEALLAAGDLSPYARAESFLLAKRYADALEAIAAEKDSRSAHLRGVIFHLQGSMEEAIRGYQMALDLIPRRDSRRVDTLLAMGIAYASQLNFDAAQKIFIQALDMLQTLSESYYLLKGRTYNLLAALRLADRDPHKAIDFCEKGLEALSRVSEEEAHPELADIYRTLGRARGQVGDNKQMLAAFQGEVNHAQSIEPRDEARIGVALYHLADSYRELGESERAIPNYRRALTHLDPEADFQSYFIAQAALHRIFFEQNRLDDAAEVSAAAIQHLDTRPPVDLQHQGYMLCIHARTEQMRDRSAQAQKYYGRWLSVLAGRTDALQDERRPFLGLLALMLAVHSLLSHQRAHEAQELAEAALPLAERYYPGTSVAWSVRRDLGEAYLGVEKWQAVVEVLAPLISEMVKEDIHTYALAHEYTGAAYAHQGNMSGALEYLRRAQMHQPEAHHQGLILERMADIQLETDNIEAAIEHTEQALGFLDHDQYPAVAARAFTKLATMQARENAHGEAIGNFEQALSLMRTLPDADYVYIAQLYVKLAASYEAQGQYPQAAIAYRNALDTLDSSRSDTPDLHRKAITRLARVQVLLQNYDDAIQSYQQARQETEMHGSPLELGEVLTALANTYREAENLEAALENYAEALALLPADEVPSQRAAVLRGQGQTLYTVGRFDEARQAWNEALVVTTDAPALEVALTYRSIAQAYCAQHRYEDAEKAFRDALGYHQSATAEAAETARLLGQALIDAKRPADAVQPLQQALDIEENLPQQINQRIVDTLYQLAQAQEGCGDLSAAITSHHKALVYMDKKQQPLQVAVRLRSLGHLYTVLERWTEAHKALEEALDIEFTYKPRSDVRIAQTLEMIATAYRREGNLEKTADAYKRMASYANLSKTAAEDFRNTLDEIQRHRSTLDVARESMAVLERTQDADIKDLVYVYALIARENAALSNHEAANEAIDKLLTALESRADSLTTADERPPYRALAHVFEAGQAASEGNLVEARAHFQRALHGTNDRAMRWVIEQGLESVSEDG